jgi:hypothetical protein
VGADHPRGGHIPAAIGVRATPATSIEFSVIRTI